MFFKKSNSSLEMLNPNRSKNRQTTTIKVVKTEESFDESSSDGESGV